MAKFLPMGIAHRVLRLLRKLQAEEAAKAIDQTELSKCLEESDSLPHFLTSLRSREKPLFFVNEKYPQSLREVLTQSEEIEIIKEADEICAHNFDLLCSGKRNVDAQPGTIDWDRDFKSGERWQPHVFYTDTVIVKGNGSE